MSVNILVIDDDDTLVFTINQFLSREGYTVFTAKDYNEAMVKIDEMKFDLIFADIILGGKTGIDLLREVKNRNLITPFVLITGYPNIESASEAVRLGAYDYIPKPVKKEILLRITKTALQHKSVLDENIKYKSNLEAIFRSVKDGIVTVDKELSVIEINEAAKKICEFNDFNVKGLKISSIQKSCDKKCLDAIKVTIKEKKPVEIYRIECKQSYSGKQIVNLSTFPLLDQQDQCNGCVMVVKDDTHLANLERDLQERYQFYNMIGKSNKMQEVYSLIDDLADIKTTVLIMGETGTGKELVAEALHYYKKSSSTPLVKVNCAALSDDLLESELFGHVKGAFTGAINNRIGRFQKADGGTIFLDEIGAISSKMQTRLLRVIETMEFERVGDSNPIKVDVRIIAATNQDLSKNVKQGKFRQDLYHRLNVVEIRLPPLRERGGDIPLLIDVLIKIFNKKFNKNIKGLSEDVKKIFMNYSWPGNVRELEHKLEHAFIVSHNSIIKVDDLPGDFKDASCHVDYDSVGGRQTVVQALEKAGWNKAKAARILGISRRSVYLKMQKYNILDP